MRTLLNATVTQSINAGALFPVAVNSQALPIAQNQRLHVWNVGGNLSGSTVNNMNILDCNVFINFWTDVAMANFVGQMLLSGSTPNNALIGQSGFGFESHGHPLFEIDTARWTQLITPPPPLPLVGFFNFSLEADVKNPGAAAQNCLAFLYLLYSMEGAT